MALPLTALVESSDTTATPRHCLMTFHKQRQSRTDPVIIPSKKHSLIQGFGNLPPGYGVERCQGIPALKVKSIGGRVDIYNDHRITESIIALTQILFATISLYRARAGQYEQYGLAAYSLTVLPFAVMSFANLVANSVSMDFPLFYLVGSPEMDEAVTRGAVFSRLVGQLEMQDPRARGLDEVRFEYVDGVMNAYQGPKGSGRRLGSVDDRSFARDTNKVKKHALSHSQTIMLMGHQT